MSVLAAPLAAMPAEDMAFRLEHCRDYLDGTVVSLEVRFVARGPSLAITASDDRLGGHGAPVRLDQPIALETLSVAKPWGQEIWYTGIEARGVCLAGGIPLPYLRDALRHLALTGPEAPILLKILDPHPAEVWGDLYFEAHEEKQEVYVATHIDRSAWPDGIGQMRFGFSEERLRDSPSDAEFRQAYLAAVDAYREVREQIDALLDAAMAKRNLHEPLTPQTRNELMAEVPAALRESEASRRAAMEAFLGTIPVATGDVIQVPRLLPHSLQHGIRVVEFQTPHYERYILSFAQKVLTQAHWDTRDALERVHLRPPAAANRASELIADFPTFQAYRYRLAPGETRTLTIPDYALVMGIEGEVILGGMALAAETACYLTSLVTSPIANRGDGKATVLAAFPKSGAA